MKFAFKPTALALVMTSAIAAPMVVFADDGAVFANPSEEAMFQVQAIGLNDRLTQLEAKTIALNSASKAGSPKALQVQRGADQTGYLVDDMFTAGKEVRLLNAKAAQKAYSEPVFYVGAYLRGQANYVRSTDAGTSSVYTNRLSLDRASIGFLSTFNDSMSAFVDITNQSPAVQHAYVLWGDLKQQPYYVLIGKNDVNFGSFQRFSLVTDSLTKTWFAPSQFAQLSVGYIEDGLEFSASFFNGESMTQSSGTPVVNATSSRAVQPRNSGRIGNFAVNSGYNFDLAGVTSKVGLGVLGGSAYVTSRHGANPAADAYADFTMGRLALHAEYVRTFHGSGSDVRATTLNNGTTTIASASENAIVDAWGVDTAYSFTVEGYDTRATFGLSQFQPSQHGHIDQLVIGYNVSVAKGLNTGLEYSYMSTYGTAGTEIYNSSKIAAVMSVYF